MGIITPAAIDGARFSLPVFEVPGFFFAYMRSRLIYAKDNPATLGKGATEYFSGRLEHRNTGGHTMANQIDVLPKATNRNVPQPGAWRLIAPSMRHIFKAIVNCPQCNKDAPLREHEIAEDGTVSPSLVCPMVNCDYHEKVKLDDWNSGRMPVELKVA